MQTTNNLEWKSSGGVFEIEESLGLSAGLRLGYDWKNFFADFQLSYFYNEMKSINVPLVFLGETDGLGFHLSGGSRIHFNDYFAGLLGGGLGGVDQESSFLLSGISVEEKDFLFSYQIFAGFELRPIDHLIIGIRYRWLRIQEMEIFSNREMHLAELSVGYVF
jgi:opacity protein-like surface antigen